MNSFRKVVKVVGLLGAATLFTSCDTVYNPNTGQYEQRMTPEGVALLAAGTAAAGYAIAESQNDHDHRHPPKKKPSKPPKKNKPGQGPPPGMRPGQGPPPGMRPGQGPPPGMRRP